MHRDALRTILWQAAGAALLIILPLAGLAAAGRPLLPYLQFPPLTGQVAHAPFQWPVFVAMALGIIAVLAPPVRHVWRYRAAIPAGRAPSHPFPAWGWFGVALTAVAWVLAWTRFRWFEHWQLFTFSPLWLGYILTVNALTHRRTGGCLLRDRPAFFLALFPVSAAFWLFFEYLNRFVQNWYYEGVDTLTPARYFCFATLPFATVLPAVLSTETLLASYPRLTAGLDRYHRVALPHPRRWALLALLLAATGLAGIGLRPDLLFPLLWLAPLLIITATQALRGRENLFTPLRAGNWERPARLALAALVCGFFWELWNVRSTARWIYTIPYVQRFHLFEMPLLGFAGYLPFGLECAVIGDAVARTLSRIPDGPWRHTLARNARPFLLFAGLLLLTALAPPDWIRAVFCRPAAELAAALLGVPCLATAEGYLLAAAPLPVHVTTACAATGFFALAAALALGPPASGPGGPRRRLRRALPRALAAAYLLTLVANAGRIALGWQAARVAHAILPASLHAGVHTATGVLVFVLFLVAAHVFATLRSQRHVRI